MSTAIFVRPPTNSFVIWAMQNYDLNTYSGRLAWAMKQAGFSNQSELARACGCRPQTIQYLLEKGKGSTINGTLAEILDVRARWLEDGRGEPFPAQEKSLANTQEHLLPSSNPVPLISWVRAGDFCEAHDPFEVGDAEKWLPCPTPHSASTFALRIVGDSMTSPYPSDISYPEGMIIFVDPERPVFNGARVIAKLEGSNQVTFKKYVEDGGRVYLKPLNPSYPVIEVTEELRICGVVIGAFREESR